MRCCLSAVVLMFIAPVVAAQGSWLPRSMDRAQTWEASLQVLYQGSEKIAGDMGAGVDFDSDEGFGFGLTYNFNNHFALGGDFHFFRPRYNARFVDEDMMLVDINYKASFSSGQLRGTWNFFEGPITPYVEGGLGWTYVDSNVTDQPPVVGCWWDPWWGYICDTFFSTYSDTNFSYGAGAGMRWDVTPQFGLRAGVSRLFISVDNATTPEFDSGRLDLIWRF